MGLFQNFPYTNFHEINLDQIIKIVRDMQEEWESTKNDWNSMQEFINNYFDNLDVSEEVLQALQTMADSGELNTIIDPVIVNQTSAWLSSHITPTTPAVDNTLSIAGAAADAKATGDAVDDLKEDIKNGEAFGVGNFHGNLIVLADDWYNGYKYKDGNNLVSVANDTYKAFTLPLIPSTTYTISSGRFIVFLKADGTVTTDAQLTNTTTFTTPSGASFAVISYAIENVPDNNFVITTDGLNIPAQVKLEFTPSQSLKIRDNITKYGTELLSMELSAIPNTIKKKARLFLSADFSTFVDISIRFNAASTLIRYTITDTNLVQYRADGSTTTWAHGLEIVNNIQVLYELCCNGYGTKITITSNGNSFTQIIVNGDNARGLVYPALTSSSTLYNVVFSWRCSDVLKDVWAFGDSYVSFDSNKRWTYYLDQDGFLDNILLSGFAGDGSSNEYKSFESMLKMGAPKILLWLTGMNDGSDRGAPNSGWLANIQKVLTICSNYNIVPILATIPTVPTINNEYKNAWVRNSGHRFIDFANAVGAQANGTWYSGMLSADGVHPTEQGAKALYYRALADCPELATK